MSSIDSRALTLPDLKEGNSFNGELIVHVANDGTSFGSISRFGDSIRLNTYTLERQGREIIGIISNGEPFEVFPRDGGYEPLKTRLKEARLW